MLPTLFTFPDSLPWIGGKGIHTYGLMIAVAFLFGLYWIKRESKRVGIDPEKTTDLYFYTIVAGLIGSRILHIIYYVPNFWTDPMVFFRVWEGGLVFQGGVILATLVVFILTKKYQLKFLTVADIYTPALAIGHGIGRLGCFFAGCCFGIHAPHFPLALTFPEGSSAPAGIPLYPTQLMEFGGEVLIFSFLLKFRKNKPFDGAVFFLYLILYSILRIFVEIIRGDREFIIEPYFSKAQLIGVVMIVISLVAWKILLKKQNQA